MENNSYVQTETTRIPAGCTLKEYRMNYASASLRKNIKTWSVVAYVLVGLNVVVSLLVNVWGLIDAAVLLGLTLGVHLKKSKGCAIALLVFSIVSCLITLIGSGSLSGWWWIILAVSYLETIKKMDREYHARAQQTAAVGDNYEY